MRSVARDFDLFDLFHQEKSEQQNPPMLVSLERFPLKPTAERAPEAQGETDLAKFSELSRFLMGTVCFGDLLIYKRTKHCL